MARKLYILCFVPVVILIRLLSPVILVRTGAVFATRIGHFALDIEVALCLDETQSGKRKFQKKLDLFYIQDKVSNTYLLELWKKALHFLPRNLLEPIHLLNQRLPHSTKFDFFDAQKKVGHSDLRSLDNSPVHLSFSKRDQVRGVELLRKLGISSGEMYVCLAVRDHLFLEETFSGLKFDYHNYRDSKIENYQAMAEYLSSQGLKVLRMGRVTKDLFVSDCPGVIDYANSQYRSDFADVFLFANSKFCISTSTGMDALATIFRVPVGLVNVVNRVSVGLGDSVVLYQPKEMHDLETGKFLTFREKVDRNLFEVFDSQEFTKRDVLLVENHAVELQEFACELYNLLEVKQPNLNKFNSVILENEYEKFSLGKLSKTWLDKHPGYLSES